MKIKGTLESVQITIGSDEPGIALIEGERVSVPREAVSALSAHIGETVSLVVGEDSFQMSATPQRKAFPWFWLILSLVLVTGMFLGYDCRGCGDCRAPQEISSHPPE